MLIKKNDSNSIKLTSQALKKGGIVIIPTDTLYGFSGIVSNQLFDSLTTEEKILKIKGREKSKGLIRLIANPKDIFKYTDSQISYKFLELWPAPLTLIVKEKNSSNTLAFRCPADEWLRNLITSTESPIYSTSVNYSKQPILSKISEIRAEFEEKVALIVALDEQNPDNSEKALSGKASTIVSLVDKNPEILRQGALKISL